MCTVTKPGNIATAWPKQLQLAILTWYLKPRSSVHTNMCTLIIPRSEMSFQAVLGVLQNKIIFWKFPSLQQLQWLPV